MQQELHGSTWTVTVNVPEDFSTPTVTYVKDKNTTNTTGAEFVNTYTEQKGNLSIKKVAGANTNLEGKTFYFKITGNCSADLLRIDDRCVFFNNPSLFKGLDTGSHCYA